MPRSVSSAGPEAVQLAHEAGLDLDPWQCDVLEDALAENEVGNWAAMEVGLVVPRQNGKGAIIEARELAGLFLFGEQLIIHSAHLFDTSLEAFRRLLFLIEDNRDFDKQVKRVSRSHGEEGIELLSGQRLRFKTRTIGGGRGLSGDLVFLDEAYNLPGAAVAALLPTLSARPNPQVWYTSSAPLASSSTLRNLCKRGRAGGYPSLAYAEWCASKDAADDDPAALAAANPGLGIRLTEQFSATERGAMEPDDFRRERLGIWREEDAEQVIDPDRWQALADPRSSLVDPVAFAMDITPDRSGGSIGVAGLRPDGLRHGELADRRNGTRWLIPRIVELVGRWKTCAVAVDATSPAASLIPDLHKHGITTDPEPGQTRLVIIGSSGMAAACGGWYDAVLEDQIRHLDQPPLNLALAGAKQRYFGDSAWKWSRKDSSVDISPLVAVTEADYAFALHGHVEEPKPQEFFASYR